MKRMDVTLFSPRRLFHLTAALTACLLSPAWAQAADSFDNIFWARDPVAYGNYSFAELDFLRTDPSEENPYGKSTWSLEYAAGDAVNFRTAAATGVAYWADMLWAGAKNTTPWQITVKTDDRQNASAASRSYSIVAEAGEPDLIRKEGENYVLEQIQSDTARPLTSVPEEQIEAGDLTSAVGNYAYSDITLGRHFGANREDAERGWWLDAGTVLPTNEQAADLMGTLRHELGHALGINASRDFLDDNGQTVSDLADAAIMDDTTYLMEFNPTITNPNLWSFHLRDENGNAAKAGQFIVTPTGLEQLKQRYPNLTEDDCFIVSLDKADDGKGYAYFYGDNVTDALGGATFFGRSALPVEGWEMLYNTGINYFEGSHLQTAGMMSHRPYSNYTGFMEAELAVMQDLGYALDRKAYFGRSIYGDGGTIYNTQGYFARNADGTAYTNDYSQVPLGIGLHVYGSKNSITQGADILTRGTGATGIRIDGMENKLAIPASTEIHADGDRGNGVLVAYGRNHAITQDGTVTAAGEGGTGVRFDFGSSSNGALDEYRGSYIRYRRDVQGYDAEVPEAKWGTIIESYNPSLTNMAAASYNAAADELNGAMVDSYDLSGSLAGAGNAIYIGRNAFVREININKGASVSGNITNDWKHFDTDGSYAPEGASCQPLKIQYGSGHFGENGYDYHAYIPDLVTNLNVNADFAYTGSITGPDNMKLNVSGGAFAYGGAADLVNVTVAKDGAIYGGSFTVNDMTERMADGFSDDTTGKFVSHGTIGASSSAANLAITGSLVSDGSIVGYGGGSGGQVAVDGQAQIEGSTVTARYLLPGENFAVLTATGGVTGETSNGENNPAAISAMLNATSARTADGVTVTAAAADNFGGMTTEQRETYRAINDMHHVLSANHDTGSLNELRPLYSMDAPAAKKALNEISSPDAAQILGMTQQSTVSAETISDRLSTAFSMTKMDVAVPTSNLTDGHNENALTMPMDIPLPAMNDVWVKFNKHWGEMKSGANYHGSAISGGYDRAVNPYWRVGTFISYNSRGYGAESASGNVYDTRFGFYAGYHKDADDAYIYMDYGWQRNRLRRGVMGMTASADYNSHLLELGGEYKHDLHAADGKIWHVSPFVGAQLSRLNQKNYGEEGAGIFNQQVGSQGNTYFAMNTGLEFKRYINKSSYALRLGVKHAFSGADPELNFNYAGNPGSTYTLKGSQDKTHFVMSLTGDTEFKNGWKLGGDLRFQKGSHDRDLSASVMIRKVW